MAAISWLLEPDQPFPLTQSALAEPNGLLAASPELTIPRLLTAYRLGIFPWYEEGQPVLWWSPDPRSVLFTDQMKQSRSLKKVLRSDRFQISFNRAFPEVIRACAETRPDSLGTWISPDMMQAYDTLHQLGHAHSVECWESGELVGGLYGINLGSMFFGESMFFRATDASKVALAHLCRFLQKHHCPLIDCQVHNGHLASLGALELPRREFESHLRRLVHGPDIMVPGSRWLPPWNGDSTNQNSRV